jgi:chromosomal replication initiation ATPase DnaA
MGTFMAGLPKRQNLDFETVVNAVCEEFACNAERIITKGRKKNKAREVAIHLARDLSGMSCKDLGFYFGGVSSADPRIKEKSLPSIPPFEIIAPPFSLTL